MGTEPGEYITETPAFMCRIPAAAGTQGTRTPAMVSSLSLLRMMLENGAVLSRGDLQKRDQNCQYAMETERVAGGLTSGPKIESHEDELAISGNF